MWVVYERPTDFPEKYVGRRFLIKGDRDEPTAEVKIADSLEELREMIPQGMFRLGRDFGNRVQILEVWL